MLIIEMFAFKLSRLQVLQKIFLMRIFGRVSLFMTLAFYIIVHPHTFPLYFTGSHIIQFTTQA
jgi:hypothetical protein